MKKNNSMAENANNKNQSSRYNYLKDMDTAKLQALLQQESFLTDDDDFDDEKIRRIVDILEEREPSFEDLDVEASLKRFKAEVISNPDRDEAHGTPGKAGTLEDEAPYRRDSKTSARRYRTHRPAIILVAAILTVLLGSTAVASAMGYDVWAYVVNWGKETLRIGTGMDITREHGTAGTTEGSGTTRLIEPEVYNTYDEALKALDISILTPVWIPDGFELTRIEATETPLHKGIIALYQAEERTLMYDATIYNSRNSSSAYEMDEGSGEVLIINNIKHYFMTNIDQWRVVWVKDKCVYSINGDITKKEIIKMLNSIYEGER